MLIGTLKKNSRLFSTYPLPSTLPISPKKTFPCERASPSIEQWIQFRIDGVTDVIYKKQKKNLTFYIGQSGLRPTLAPCICQCLKVILRGNGEASLDNVNPESSELTGNVELILGGEGRHRGIVWYRIESTIENADIGGVQPPGCGWECNWGVSDCGVCGCCCCLLRVRTRDECSSGGGAGERRKTTKLLKGRIGHEGRLSTMYSLSAFLLNNTCVL